jgi:hypothetical protein
VNHNDEVNEMKREVMVMRASLEKALCEASHKEKELISKLEESTRMAEEERSGLIK